MRATTLQFVQLMLSTIYERLCCHYTKTSTKCGLKPNWSTHTNFQLHGVMKNIHLPRTWFEDTLWKINFVWPPTRYAIFQPKLVSNPHLIDILVKWKQNLTCVRSSAGERLHERWGPTREPASPIWKSHRYQIVQIHWMTENIWVNIHLTRVTLQKAKMQRS